MVLFSGMLFPQKVITQPKFEIADVHATPKGVNSRMLVGVAPNGRYEIRSATMVNLIGTAYGFDTTHIIGGPGWIESNRFDVIAKAPPSVTTETLKVMLQLLLTERFKLTVHRDTKVMPTYVLRTGPKLTLKAGAGPGDSGCKLQSLPGQVDSEGKIEYLCQNVTMAAFADVIPHMLGFNLGDGPVLDQTGLEGSWSFKVRWSPVGIRPVRGDNGSTLNAINEQLGLKLQQESVNTPVIIVDHVDENPTPNPKGLADRLGAESLPTKFDVATVKHTDRGRNRLPRFEIQPGGRFVAEGLTLKNLVNRALYDGNGHPIVGLPSWANSELFDVAAQIPRSSALFETEAIGPMLHDLLVERFKMATHIENRPLSIYEVVAIKPKMRKADPVNRSHCHSVALPPSPSAALSRSIDCQNITIPQFAVQLGILARESIDLPVEDGTGLKGAWDFTLSFSLSQMPHFNSLSPSVKEAEGIAASEPTGAISIFDALEKQLGLKLERRKRSMPVIVIDHLERNPTDN